MTKPKAHRCKDCDGTLIPIEMWDDHVKVHRDQLDLFTGEPRKEPEAKPKSRGSRKRQMEGIA